MVTKYTYIRNVIHHSGSYDEITDDELYNAILFLRKCFLNKTDEYFYPSATYQIGLNLSNFS